jgi:hypothetical protein
MKAIDVTGENLKHIACKTALANFGVDPCPPTKDMKPVPELPAHDYDLKADIKPDNGHPEYTVKHGASNLHVLNLQRRQAQGTGFWHLSKVCSGIQEIIIVMITRLFRWTMVIAGFALVLILSYYLNVTLDLKGDAVLLPTRHS